MTPDELALECKRVIETMADLMGPGYRARLVLNMPPSQGRDREFVRLGGRAGGPRGRVVGSSSKGRVVDFDAIEVLAWLHARGLVEVEVAAAPTPEEPQS